jgi:hypothetical protein
MSMDDAIEEVRPGGDVVADGRDAAKRIAERPVTVRRFLI